MGLVVHHVALVLQRGSVFRLLDPFDGVRTHIDCFLDVPRSIQYLLLLALQLVVIVILPTVAIVVARHQGLARNIYLSISEFADPCCSSTATETAKTASHFQSIDA